MKRTLDGVTTIYVGQHYEKNLSPVEVTKYYYASGQRVAMRKAGVVSFLHTDHLGSTSLTTAVNGYQVGSTQRYELYGEPRAPVLMSTDRLYTGQVFDRNVELMYYGARYYDPVLGRFVQADTIVPNTADPQSFNRYSYVLGNPLRYTDPSGHCIVGEDGQCDVEATRELYRDWWMYRRAVRAMRIMIWREQRPNERAMEGAAHVLWNRAGHNINRVLPEVSKPGQFAGFHRGPPSKKELAGAGERGAWVLGRSISQGVIRGSEGYEDKTNGALFFANILESEEQTYEDTMARLLQEKSDTYQPAGDVLIAAGYERFVHNPWQTDPEKRKLFVYNRSLSVAVSEEYKVANPKTPFSSEDEWKEWGQK